MKPLTKLYLKIFLITGVPFGIMMTLLNSIIYTGNGIYEFFIHTLVFGGIMSIWSVNSHKKGLIKNGITVFDEKTLSVKQFKEVKSGLSKSELYERLKSDKQIGIYTIKETDEGYSITTKVSWKSWGEKIKILIKDLNSDIHTFQILSKPVMASVQVDNGRNLHNILHIEKLINNVS